jgi:hypothetical protein
MSVAATAGTQMASTTAAIERPRKSAVSFARFSGVIALERTAAGVG